MTSLAGARLRGLAAGSGETDSPILPPPTQPQLNAELLEETPPPAGADLTPLPGVPRPQVRILSMPTPSVEYAEPPRLDGHHAEIINRPSVATLGDMRAWLTPAPVWREIPPTDAEHPPPCGCGECGR